VLKFRDSREMYKLAVSYFLEEDLKELGLNSSRRLTDLYNESGLDLFSSMMLMDLKTYLPDDILVKVDRATMAVALEGREPFLDHKILEWTCQLPTEFKYRNGVSKYILRKVLYKYVPKELLDRPKQGFRVPIYKWFKKDLKELYKEYLNEHRISSAGIFDSVVVKRLFDDYFMDRVVNHNKIWLLFVFELWREGYL